MMTITGKPIVFIITVKRIPCHIIPTGVCNAVNVQFIEKSSERCRQQVERVYLITGVYVGIL